MIVSITDEHALIDVGSKIEGRIPVEEIKDLDGNLMFKAGDEIDVLMTGHRGERPTISYRKALKAAKKEEFIKQHKDNLEG